MSAALDERTRDALPGPRPALARLLEKGARHGFSRKRIEAASRIYHKSADLEALSDEQVAQLERRMEAKIRQIAAATSPSPAATPPRAPEESSEPVATQADASRLDRAGASDPPPTPVPDTSENPPDAPAPDAPASTSLALVDGARLEQPDFGVPYVEIDETPLTRSLSTQTPYELTPHARKLEQLLKECQIPEKRKNEVRWFNKSLYARGYLAPIKYILAAWGAIQTRKPVLLIGTPGCGKTMLAEACHDIWNPGTEPCRVDFHEQISARDLLYEFDPEAQRAHWEEWRARHTAGESVDWGRVAADARSRRFMVTKPLVEALEYGARTDVPEQYRRRVFLGDEVDKTLPAIESMLLGFLNGWQVQAPDVGQVRAVPGFEPIAFLTSNFTRQLTDPLLDRCEVFVLDPPTVLEEDEILAAQIPRLDATVRRELLLFAARVRQTVGLSKPLSIREMVAISKKLAYWETADLTPRLLSANLSCLAKDRGDQYRLNNRIQDCLAWGRAEIEKAGGQVEALRLYAERQEIEREKMKQNALR